jgi:hypothetical protein
MKVVVKKGMKPPIKPPAPVQPIAPDPETGEEQFEAEANPNVEIEQPMAVVSKTYPDGTYTEEQSPVGEPGQVPAPHATVSVSMGMTVPTVQYGNIKFQVFLACPCEVNQESIDGTYEEVKGWVDAKVGEIHEEINAQLG